MHKQNSDKSQQKLFPIGLTLLLFSTFLAIALKIYANFFKFRYYQGLTAPEKQQWWREIVNVEQAVEFFSVPLVFVLLIVTVMAAIIGATLIIVAIKVENRNAEGRNLERVEQWLKDNPPKKRRT